MRRAAADDEMFERAVANLVLGEARRLQRRREKRRAQEAERRRREQYGLDDPPPAWPHVPQL